MKDITEKVKNGDNFVQVIQMDPDVFIAKTVNKYTLTGAETHDTSDGLTGLTMDLPVGETFHMEETRYSVYIRGLSETRYTELEDGKLFVFDDQPRFEEHRWEYYRYRFGHDSKHLSMLGGEIKQEDLVSVPTRFREYLLPLKLRAMLDEAFPEAKGLKCDQHYQPTSIKGPNLWANQLDDLLSLCYTASLSGMSYQTYVDENGKEQWGQHINNVPNDDPGPEIVLEDDHIKSFIGSKVGHDCFAFGVLEHFPDLKGKRQFLVKWATQCPHCKKPMSYHTGTGCHHGAFCYVIDPKTGEYLTDLRNSYVVCKDCLSSKQQATLSSSA